MKPFNKLLSTIGSLGLSVWLLAMIVSYPIIAAKVGFTTFGACIIFSILVEIGEALRKG